MDELDDTAARWKSQVLFQVPEDRRRERPGGGNSILWACFHASRHADLALAVLAGTPLLLPPNQNRDGGGLEEREPPWSEELVSDDVDNYVAEVLTAVRRYLSILDPDELDRTPDTPAALAGAGIPDDRFDWLYRIWSDRPASFLVRWPLTGHIGNHVGEMVATRDRMGLSPF